jgi:hypothetical protein
LEAPASRITIDLVSLLYLEFSCVVSASFEAVVTARWTGVAGVVDAAKPQPPLASAVTAVEFVDDAQ